MDRCALFIDAGYALADGAMAVHGTRRRDSVTWDHAGLLKLLAGLARDRTGLPVLRCYWYETSDGRRTAEQDELAEMPGLKLRLVTTRPGRREGIDGQLKSDLVTLAKSGAISDAFIASADEHLAEVVAEVQDLGLRVVVLHIASDGGWTIPAPLRQECDDIVEISGVHLRPFVELVRGAEPASADDQYASGSFGSRSVAEASAGLTGALTHHGLPAAALPAPGAVYPAPAGPDYRSGAQPYAAVPGSSAAYQTAGGGQPDSVLQLGGAADGVAQGGGSGQHRGAHAGSGQIGSPHAGDMTGGGAHASAPQGGYGAGLTGATSGSGAAAQPGAPISPYQGTALHAGSGHNGMASGPAASNVVLNGTTMTGSMGSGSAGSGSMGSGSMGSGSVSGGNGQAQPVGGPGQHGSGQHGQGQQAGAHAGSAQPGGSHTGGSHASGAHSGGVHAGQPGYPGTAAHGTPGAQHAGPMQNGPMQNGAPQARFQGASHADGSLPAGPAQQNGYQNGGQATSLGGPGGYQNGTAPGGYQNGPGPGVLPNGMPPATGVPNGSGSASGGQSGQGPAGYGAAAGQGGGPTASYQVGGYSNASAQGSQPQNGFAPAGYQNGSGPGSTGYHPGPTQSSPAQNALGPHGQPYPGQPQSGGAAGGYLNGSVNGPVSGSFQAGDQRPGMPAGMPGGYAAAPTVAHSLPYPAPDGGYVPGHGGQGPDQPRAALAAGHGPGPTFQPVPQYLGQPQPVGQHQPVGQPQLAGQSQPVGQPQAAVMPAVRASQPVAISLPDAVKAAHAEGFSFGETVGRDAPGLWLEAVLARKPRMPSDLEARLLQGSALPIDSLLHDEVRHSLRRGFWDALEGARR